jgi:hypothetical protein
MVPEQTEERVPTENAEAGSEAEETARAVHLGPVPLELPALDFSGFVLSLAQTVLIELGVAPDPEGGFRKPDLSMARETIDIIAMLAEKTKGNLTGDEERLLDDTLYQLRMTFCEVRKQRT